MEFAKVRVTKWCSSADSRECLRGILDDEAQIDKAVKSKPWESPLLTASDADSFVACIGNCDGKATVLPFTGSLDDALRRLAFKQVGTTIASLERQRAADLYHLLGKRGHETVVGDAGSYKGDFVRPDPPELTKLGKRSFKRCARALHDLLCDEQEGDQSVREQVLAAMQSGNGPAFIASLLVSHFMIGTEVATAVAILFCRLILSPAGEEFCSSLAVARKPRSTPPLRQKRGAKPPGRRRKRP